MEQELTDSQNPEDYINYARQQAMPYARRAGVPVDDSEQFADALLGLCQAQRTFDPGRQYKFITYSGYAIRSCIAAGHRRRSRGWRELRVGKKSVTISGSINNLPQTFTASGQHSRQDLTADLVSELPAALQSLPDSSREVIIDWMHGRKLSDIAVDRGVTRQRISQIFRAAIASLREYFKKRVDVL